ncbi:MAG: enoyl-CoA hydratase/isomerase family protein [Dehalococcoidia bacterium]|nr:enoyl-CoA hydratase/isomerase family protein [Dehalococcoidia bacterium]
MQYERRGRVGLVTLNRPERLNAWTDQMRDELKDAVASANDDPEVGAIVFTGSGRAYCAGADVGGWADAIEKGQPRRGSATEGDDNWVKFIQRHPKPTLAALNGAAVGVGITHVLPMDIRIASDSARIGVFLVGWAWCPSWPRPIFSPRWSAPPARSNGASPAA